MSVINPRAGRGASPCQGKCTLTTGDRVCRGCGRTEEEFANWGTYSVEERERIKVMCQQRLAGGEGWDSGTN